MSELKTIRVSRDGDQDLEFRGALVAEVSTHSHFGPRQNRWTEINLYQTEGDRWVAWVVHRTCWQGETDAHLARACDSAADVRAFLVDTMGALTDEVKDLLRDAGLDDETIEVVS
jgi:hypothetical protein